MKKKLFFLCIFSIQSSLLAGGGNFYNIDGSNWYTTANWTGGGAPTGAEGAWINGDAVIGSGSAATNYLQVGQYQDGSIDVAAGASLAVNHSLVVAGNDGVATISDGDVTVAGNMTLAAAPQIGQWGAGSMILNGNANVNATAQVLYLGLNPGSSGYLELNDNAYMQINWLNMEGTYWGYASEALVQLNGGTLFIENTGGISIWRGLAQNKIVFNGGSLKINGDYTNTAQSIYDYSDRFEVAENRSFSATYDDVNDLTTVQGFLNAPPTPQEDHRGAGQLVLTGSSTGNTLANIYPGREIFSPNSPAYPNGSPYSQWRMYYSGWDVDVTGATVLQTEMANFGGHARDRTYMATSTDGVNWTKHPVAILEPSGPSSDPNSQWINPDGMHAGDPSPVIGPDNKMYMFYTGAYAPEGVPGSSLNVIGTICVACADSSHDGPFIKSSENPIIWPWGGEDFVNGSTFMPTVKYHKGKFKMWFLGAEKLDGTQSFAPIAIWYTECIGNPMVADNWMKPVKVYRTEWVSEELWDRYPFYIYTKIHTDLSYQIFYTGYNYVNEWEGIQLGHRQVGINSFWSSNGTDVIEGMDNANGEPILQGRFHEPNSTYSDGYFMALSYVDGWMYYGAYDHPDNPIDAKIYRYNVGEFDGTLVGLMVIVENWLEEANPEESVQGDLNNDSIVNFEDFSAMTCQAVDKDPVLPLRWGFDDIGVLGRNCWNEQCLLTHPKRKRLMDEFSFNFWLTWWPDAACNWTYEKNKQQMQAVDQFCKENGMHWILNQVAICWSISPECCADPYGYDWYCRTPPDNRRFYLLPEELRAELGNCDRCLGVMYDEPEHHQNNNNSVAGYDRPSIYDWTSAEGDLKLASDGHVAAVSEVVELYGQYGLEVYTEQVFPVLYHNFARGGCVAGTKILKETWGPVYLACAVGAAKQYGTELWVSPDLWGISGYPGHSPLEYKSALLLAYHMGADCIYTESLGLLDGSLVEMTSTNYTVTEYGEFAKWFIDDYVPSNPRQYNCRQVKPRVAIVRQPDGCWGQKNVFAYPSVLPDKLYGNPNWQTTSDTEAWIKIWHLLTRGAVSQQGLSWWVSDTYIKPYQVFCPLDGVVVFDHHVGFENLEGVEVIFLTGIGVSPETLDAISQCVTNGATCVSLTHLAPKTLPASDPNGIIVQGNGRWIITNDFLSDTVRNGVSHVIPSEDVIRYQFGDNTVIMRNVGNDNNRITVEVLHQN